MEESTSRLTLVSNRKLQNVKKKARVILQEAENLRYQGAANENDSDNGDSSNKVAIGSTASH